VVHHMLHSSVALARYHNGLSLPSHCIFCSTVNDEQKGFLTLSAGAEKGLRGAADQNGRLEAENEAVGSSGLKLANIGATNLSRT